ncbi:MAG: methyltransferase domain-containing protein [Pirellulales bacterium]|nr:methyltransferase domain-containing protein [Pirellulales bacterium]
MADRTEESWRPPLLKKPENSWQRFLAAIRRWFDLQAGSAWRDLVVELAEAKGAVVDAGCGCQPYRCLLPPDVRYLGIDMVDSKDQFGYHEPDTIYYSGTTWPVADGTANLVLLTETIEHVFDTSQFLAEAQRCLRRNGLLLITVPFAARWHFIPNDFWRFTPSCLKRLLDEAGFDQIAVYARGNAVTVASYKIMALIQPFLLPQGCGFVSGMIKRFLGLLASPLFVLCAVVGNLSLRGSGGDDCLGYTVLARKPG